MHQSTTGFILWQWKQQIRHHPEYKLAIQDWIQLKLLRRNMEWFDYSIPLCPPEGLDSNKFNALECMFLIQVKDKLFGEDWLKCFTTEILDAKYKKTDVVKGHERTHSSECTSKSRLALSATGEQKDVQWNSWRLSTWKDFQKKGRQQSTLDQHLMSTEQSRKR